MADRMIFPKNPMDFIKEHTEFVNGLYVMPAWRVEQLVSHYILERNREIVERLESELKWTRAEQSIECTRHNGYGSPLQSKNSGKIESLKKTIEILKEECGISE